MQLFIRAILAATLVLPMVDTRASCLNYFDDPFYDSEFLLKIETYSDIPYLSSIGELRILIGQTQFWLASPINRDEKGQIIMGIPDARAPDLIYNHLFKNHDPDAELQITLLNMNNLSPWEQSRFLNAPLILKITGDKEILLNAFKSPTLLYYSPSDK